MIAYQADLRIVITRPLQAGCKHRYLVGSLDRDTPIGVVDLADLDLWPMSIVAQPQLARNQISMMSTHQVLNGERL